MGNKKKESEFLWSGKLALLAGVSPDTLRHYERKGVLPQPTRSRSGYREYQPESLQRIRIVRRALAMGFTLNELGALFRARQSGSPPCREARHLASAKLEEVERWILELQQLRSDLKEVLRDWDRRLRRTPGDRPAHLLESLADGHYSDEGKVHPMIWRKRPERKANS